MKKLYTLLLSGLLSIGMANAQSSVELTPSPFKPLSGSTPFVAAMWDQNFVWDISGDAGAGNAAVVFTGTTYWASRWASDTLFEYDASGNFLSSFSLGLPGIAAPSCIRSMTYDGSFVYAGANTSQIFKINPATKAYVSTINTGAAGVPLVRYCTYDASANGGAGGFWIGTWNTDWTLVSMTGSYLSSILASDHGLASTYGIAYDGATLGGPYIWAFNQTDTAISTGEIYQFEVATGWATGVYHDVANDLGVKTDLAGGLYFDAASLSLIGILQGTPNRLFSYSVDPTGINENAATPGFLTAYPNPVSDRVNIGVKRSNNDPMNMQIIDAAGKVVYQSSAVGISNYLSMSKYSAGVYTVKVTYGEKVYTTKFVKE